MWGIIVALISGLLMSVQGVMNTGVTKQTSLWVSAGFVQFSALIVCIIAWLIAWLITGRESISSLAKVSPKYMLLGGVIGAFITITVIESMKRLGPAKSVMLIVIMQIVSAYVIELMGILGTDKAKFYWGKVIGAAIAVTGVIIFFMCGEKNIK